MMENNDNNTQSTENSGLNQQSNLTVTDSVPTAPATTATNPATIDSPETHATPTPQVEPTSVQPTQNAVTPNPGPTPTLNAPSPQPPPVYTTGNDEKEKHGNGVVSFIVTVVVALLLTQIINLFFFQSYRVFGSSMYSTLHDGDRLIVNKISKTMSKIKRSNYQPQRGQIIVFTSPKDPDLQLIKRVIGLPGERVVVKNSKITVYNKEHPEGFNPDDADYGKNLPPTSGEADVTVPANNIFVSGDNRIGSNSLDSRNELGTVPENLIIGTASVRLWPLQTARFF
jgi:signal peptidase I